MTVLTFPWWCCQQGRQWGWPPSAMYLCPARGASHTWAKKLLGIVFWTCQLVLMSVFDIKALSGIGCNSESRTNWALFYQVKIVSFESYSKTNLKHSFGQPREYLTKTHPAAEMFQVVSSPLCSSVLGWEDQLVTSIAPAKTQITKLNGIEIWCFDWMKVWQKASIHCNN